MRLRCLITAFAAFSVYQVQGSCERALGMNNGRIKDKQITSPSARDNKHMPHHARKGHSSSWCSAAQNFSYIQVALGGVHVIRAVTIEGGGVKTLMWVAHYTISYRSYGAWRWYQENGKKKILVGVKKFNDHKKSLLNNVIADVIRVHPQNVSGVSPSSSHIEHACLRLELYGCPAHGCQAPVIPIGAVLVQLIQYRMPLHGAMAIFACKGGLYLRGIPIQNCRSGRWSNATFECIAPCVDSFKPKQNERIEYGFKNGIREARFVCNKGHIMERGNKTLRCVQGKWIGIRPVCRAPCSDPGYLVHGTRHGNDFTHNKTVTFQCINGYKMNGSRSLTCNDGTWSSSVPTCEAPTCSAPVLYPNSRIIYPPNWMTSRFKYGDVVVYMCAVGDQLGDSSSTCSNGVWTSRKYQCVVPCTAPSKQQGRKVIGIDYRHGKSIQFECDFGYNLMGNKQIWCKRGRWSHPLPNCKAKDCGRLPAPANGRKSFGDRTTFGGTVRFHCNGHLGYELKGSQQRTCEGNGQWSGVQTTCQLISCGDPGIVRYGRQIASNANFYGSTVRFICNRGYKLVGDNRIICQKSKTWSGVPPKCYASCPSPPRVTGRIVRGNDFSHGQSISFSCDRDYVMFGRRTIRCSNGQWSDRFPDCNEPCAAPAKQQGRKVLGADYRHGKTLTFTCEFGYILMGKKQIRCNAGNWTHPHPNCKDCNQPLGMEDSRIPNSKITASEYSSNAYPHLARLHGNGAWCTKKGGRKAYLQINLGTLHRITAIALQGSYIHWIDLRPFRVWYKRGQQFVAYKEGRQTKAKVFPGGGKTSVRKYKFKKVIETTTVRIYPKIAGMGFVCLRIELNGCKLA